MLCLQGYCDSGKFDVCVSHASKLMTAPGATMSEAELSVSHTRYLYAELLPSTEVKSVPIVQDGLDGREFRWRESCVWHNEDNKEK